MRGGSTWKHPLRCLPDEASEASQIEVSGIYLPLMRLMNSCKNRSASEATHTLAFAVR